MTLRVTNTLTGEKEPFEPRDPDSVLLYYCGLTTSDPPHLGHARGWVHVDVMARWLDYLGYDVHHVENLTDVNEKIVARVGEDGDSEADVARHYVQQAIDDMRSLNLGRAEVYPRVSEHVPEIIDLVERLIEQGHAYEQNGSVYFDVTSFEDYGKLSNQSVDDIESQGADTEGEKRHPADFALWKAGGVDPADIAEHQHPEAAPAEEACQTAQIWDSPWGEGRPGWHIECSAMSMTHLDESIDIHVGGQDLVFPHHENEVAQSEAATGKQFANYWLHVRLLETEEEKMSSSLGNYFTVADAVEEFGPDVLRTFLLSTAYTSRATYSDETIAEAKERWDRLSRGYERAVEACDDVDAHTKVTDETLRDAVEDARSAFEAALNDDFNTREAMTALLDLTAAVNTHVDGHDEYDYQGLRRAVETFEEFGGGILGLAFGDDDSGDVSLAGDVVDLVLTVRQQEREAGNYERADELRDELEALGVEVQDTDDGPTYRL
ncbi:cysteinyl-tRNA synthetase [Haloarcula marismortui ATCC 43049]|uniref:Cysteine--tRNA ligase n=2 Tax=Haloarcula marismortui (strain ATCC 43049 / DSM 3752 / JCM 8966 / VKM B-1809) TaxID=272569 RepID=SYC_HALMA|nr:cysteine--tRNA ligase [Haloarcula marismortui]Q5V2M3.1 RecName: Full=Cysteine--tRNA ligase; AltName: Full=Cysteinyl-tRNA synthetase; Short=CysRS [Haloarcula marismortui ATCC 43049]AAV46229.1 cysteinyl-tRNA synthetase [Haloarcula marismortui ATCC 43049]QCP90978.1 cysteine--tRNA ligase [Haloarcula marismortui ATCC 43049]